jgi:hypothetical protein
MIGTRILTLSTIALLSLGIAKPTQAAEYGTAEEARALADFNSSLSRGYAYLAYQQTDARLLRHPTESGTRGCDE